ncbi:MAG: hypothetical protein ACPL4K_06090 [Candidatus Margulisiibacteriota bacterium]
MELEATIKVGAVFKGDKIIPKWFVWEGRKYEVKEINYYWKDHQGIEELHCFSVTDGTNGYELSFNTKKTVWKLNRIKEA